MNRLVVILSFFIITSAQGQTWVATYQAGGDEVVNDIIETTAGTFIACGADYFANTTDTFGFIVEIDAGGQIMQSNQFTAPYSKTIYYFVLEIDSGYMLFGSMRTTDTSGEDIFVQLLDTDFNSKWIKIYGNPDYKQEIISDVFIDSSGYIFIGGFGLTDTSLNDDLILYRLSPNGDSLKSRYIHDEYGWNYVSDMLQFNSNKYRLFVPNIPGSQTSTIAGYIDIDTNLIFLNWQLYDGMNFNSQFSNEDTAFFYFHVTAKWLTDTTYICVGWLMLDTLPWGGDDVDLIGYAEFDTSNITVKNIAFGIDSLGSYSGIKGMDFISKSNIFIGGVTNALDNYQWWGNNDTKLIIYKTDSTGAVLWNKEYGGDGYYYLYDILATSDGGCLLAATFYDENNSANYRDAFFLKIDKNGIIDNVSEVIKNEYHFTLFPNPTTGSFTVQAKQQGTVTVLDIAGRTIATGKLNEEINLQGEAGGLYFIRAEVGGIVQTYKLVVVE
jgi:type IX secretion system substrate protein